ncbi:MAG: hypothetical protein DME26_07195, partial [Verrucomicrobia bacterium]
MAIVLVCVGKLEAALPPATNDYFAVDAIFTKHCLDCHAAQDPEAKLVLESFETLKTGGESGVVFVPGKSAESLLVKMIEGKFEKDGKKKIMPPGKRQKLEPEEIAAIKSWIDAGAKAPPEGRAIAKQLMVPKITPKTAPRKAIYALAYAPGPKLIAVGRYGEVELRSAETRAVVRTLSGHRGNVSALVFSSDDAYLFAAAGEPALFGEVRQWKVSDGELVRTIEGHKDAIYSVALSPDGKTLATGSYDQKIKLWKVETGEELKTISGHNGCVFDLAFRPDGKILASASADRTVKLWDVTSAERRDTLSQPLKEVYAVAFSLDGKRLYAGGVDNRIRIWEVSETAAETTNPILDSKFAHEGAILNIVFSSDGKTLLTSADDRTVKLWEADGLKEKSQLERQPDWVPALTFASENKIVVGRLDGSLGYYDATTGKPIPPAKPELSHSEPRGLQRGRSMGIRLSGKNLIALTEVKFQNAKLTGAVLHSDAVKESSSEARIQVTVAPDLPRGSYEFSVTNAGGESGKLKLHVDDLPQVYESETNKLSADHSVTLPVSVWGTLDPMGDTDEIEFHAKTGQTIVLDVAAMSVGSKAKVAIALFDAKGNLVAQNSGFDGGDPLMAHTIPKSGAYRVQVTEQTLGASNDHFYRLSIGSFAYAVGAFPLSVTANAETEAQLIGFNLGPKSKVRFKPEKLGEMDLPIDEANTRSRRTLKVLVTDVPELVEAEPNDTPAQATKIQVPGAVNGRIWPTAKGQATDVDLFKFDAKGGQTWVIETTAARNGSPIDTRIEVLHPDGKPVERLLLQAVRDSHVTFRGIDSTSPDCRVENWEEMELNQYLYLQGEVVKLFRAPQGPDSGFLFYSSNGKRRAYFDTSATAHALDEPCYIVEAHPVGVKLPPTGLPVFTLSYANDDDGERKLGSDSKLFFTAPSDGSYLVRVSDSRNYSGNRFAYRLAVREPKPDFKVTLNGANPTVSAGSGQSFSVNVERMDGFDGEIRVDMGGLPPGFSVSTPLVIEAGHSEAKGTLNAATDAPEPNETNAAMTKVTATAMVNGELATKEVNNFGKIKLGQKPKVFVYLEPYAARATHGPGPTNGVSSIGSREPLELTISSGQTVPALLRIQRNGHEDLVTFFLENLPHGVIVDNIGLNGVLIPKDE